MKQVRILKDGEYDNIKYKKGEIWDFKRFIEGNIKVAIISKNKKETRVTLYDSKDYGQEAEIINEPEEINIQLW